MPTTDEELEQLQAGVEERRQVLADTQAARDEAVQASANDLRKAELLAEKERLDREIAEEERLLDHQLNANAVQSNADEAEAAMQAALTPPPPPPSLPDAGDNQDEEV